MTCEPRGPVPALTTTAPFHDRAPTPSRLRGARAFFFVFFLPAPAGRRARMNGWIGSLTSWGLIAIGVFWYVGAHNRLVRLRAAATQAYGQLDAALMAQVQHVQAMLADTPPPADEVRRGLDTALRGACGQLAASLGAARVRPLHAPTMATVGAAVRAWVAAWHRHSQQPGQDMPALRPGDLLAGTAWPLPASAIEVALPQFNAAVAQYNAAVTQFPAVIVAWLARFRVGAPLV